ncbi:heterokaryon incompatibility protein [Rutstroemia sp. NJR-2017a BVV2]|nr:heterokaryon incompatibility protein [Rutstroemia sp. NJR-2017a BVV2]
MAASICFNNACKYCLVLTVDHSEAFLKTAGDLSIDYERFDTFPDFPQLNASSKDGCAFCGLLRASCRSHCSYEDPFASSSDGKKSFEINVQIYRAKITAVGRGRGMTTLQFSICPIDRAYDSSSLTTIYFNLYCCNDSPAKSQIKQPQPLPTALDPRNVQRITNWMEECKEFHERCRLEKGPPCLPTRVIDVGPPDGSRDPRLYITHGITRVYTALSHCWGPPSKDQYKTLLSNIEHRLEAMPMSELPQNFRDAIIVTRALGLRYLWIDSICIIQDSKDDWEVEIKNMGSIYGTAHLVVAATSSSSSNSGFLAREVKASVQMPLHSVNGSPLGQYCIRSQSRAGGGGWFQDIGMSPWNMRGWTLQERLLSRRVIHFTTEKIYFECCTTDSSEEGDITRDMPGELDTMMASLEFQHLLGLTKQISSIQKVDGYEAAARSAYNLWYTLVTMFSGRQLTFESDKFPAISGLAVEIGALLKDSYLFGLWLNDLVMGLMWQPNIINMSQGYPRVSKGGLRQAPSWSWAAYNGGVSYYSNALSRDSDGQSLRIIEANPMTSGFTPPEMSAPAKLKVSGLLKQATIFRTGKIRGDKFRLVLDGEVGGAWDNRVKINNEEVGDCSLDCRHPSSSGENVRLLKVMNRTREDTVNYGVPAGLILEEVDKGVFQRVGLFNLDFTQESVFDNEQYQEIIII